MEMTLGHDRGLGNAPYMKEAVHDLKTSANSLLDATPNYGQSKWSSLQAVEKVLKSCILQRGGKPPRVHRLSELAEIALNAGVPGVAPQMLSALQCSAEVRYDSTKVGRDEAVLAHHTAIDLCAELCPTLKRTNADSAVWSSVLQTSERLAVDVLCLGSRCHTPPQP
jgi:hypothetical protein